MSNHNFTEEQMKELQSNRYVSSVSKRCIKFSHSFWEEFHKRYLSGENRYDICASMGLNPMILGAKRLEYICRTIRNSAGMPIKKQKRPASDTKYSEMPQQEAIKAMETELTYLRQEVEFLKKISQLAKEEKRLK